MEAVHGSLAAASGSDVQPAAFAQEIFGMQASALAGMPALTRLPGLPGLPWGLGSAAVSQAGVGALAAAYAAGLQQIGLLAGATAPHALSALAQPSQVLTQQDMRASAAVLPPVQPLSLGLPSLAASAALERKVFESSLATTSSQDSQGAAFGLLPTHQPMLMSKGSLRRSASAACMPRGSSVTSLVQLQHQNDGRKRSRAASTPAGPGNDVLPLSSLGLSALDDHEASAQLPASLAALCAAANMASGGKAIKGEAEPYEGSGEGSESEPEAEELQGDLDERELKRLRRKLSNRESARRSRMRKQAEVEGLATQVSALKGELSASRTSNSALRELVERLVREKGALVAQVRALGGTVPADLEWSGAALATSLQLQQQ